MTLGDVPDQSIVQFVRNGELWRKDGSRLWVYRHEGGQNLQAWFPASTPVFAIYHDARTTG